VVADRSRTACVVTVSDGVFSGEREDVSGDRAEEMLRAAGLEVQRALVRDELSDIEGCLRERVARGTDLVVTTGGTGFGPRDVTPEATKRVIEREAPGVGELMRAAGLDKTPMAALSRAVAGAAGRTLIVNLPGSPKGVEESLDSILELIPHALQLLRGETAH
jgi:molybdopterin adenylyltransferase